LVSSYLPAFVGLDIAKLIGPKPVIQVTPTPYEYLKSSIDGL